MNKWVLIVVSLLCTIPSAWADLGVNIKSLALSPALKGGESQSALTIQTTGEGYLLCLDYTVNCGGITTSESLDLFSLEPTSDGTYTIPFTYRVPTTAGRYPTTVRITGINFDDATGTSLQMNGSTTTVERQEARYTLVEEFTGTGCGNCPRGWLGMQRIKENASDKAGVIAIHQYNVNDPMYCNNYFTPHFTGAPACWLDRTLYPDPLEGANEEGILTTLEHHNKRNLATVALTVAANFTTDGTAVDVSSSTEFLTSGTGYTIAYALTADGLTGKESNWKQTNYYNENSAWMLDLLYPGQGMEIFGKGGQYGTDPVQLVYDDVLINSTWESRGTAWESTVSFTGSCEAGTTQQNSASLSLPVSTSLRKALDPTRIYATVIVLDEQGHVANAARCHVENTTHIASPTQTQDAAVSNSAFDLQGRPLNLKGTRHKGMFIMNGEKVIR